MPAIDKPIEELKQYLGCSPKPQDFEGFWDRGLAEVRALEGGQEWVDVDFAVHCRITLFFEAIYLGILGFLIDTQRAL